MCGRARALSGMTQRQRESRGGAREGPDRACNRATGRVRANTPSNTDIASTQTTGAGGVTPESKPLRATCAAPVTSGTALAVTISIRAASPSTFEGTDASGARVTPHTDSAATAKKTSARRRIDPGYRPGALAET